MMLGAQSVRPDMKVKIIWVNSWYDPGKEAAAAKRARRPGRRRAHPAHRLGRRHAVRRRARHLRVRPGLRHDQVRAEGAAHRASSRTGARITSTACSSRSTSKWTSGDFWGGFSTKIVHMAPFTNMPDDVKKLAEDTEAAIKSGKLHPFKCPVLAQDGKPVECKGGDAPRRRADPRHELLRQGHRRQAAAGCERPIPPREAGKVASERSDGGGCGLRCGCSCTATRRACAR